MTCNHEQAIVRCAKCHIDLIVPVTSGTMQGKVEFTYLGDDGIIRTAEQQRIREGLSMSKYPKITKPWKPVGQSSIETHDGEMLVKIRGEYVNPWMLQMICDGVNFLARSWLEDAQRVRELEAEISDHKHANSMGYAQLDTQSARIAELEAALKLIRPYVDKPMGASVDRVLAGSTSKKKDGRDLMFSHVPWQCKRCGQLNGHGYMSCGRCEFRVYGP